MAANTTSHVGWVAQPDIRGTLDIIWSCGLVFVACTWTILHLEVPDPSSTQSSRFWEKLKWMIITALTPELITGEAFAQWQSVRHYIPIMQDLGSEDWTKAHSFIAIMGGLAINDTDGKYRALTLAETHLLAREGYLSAFPLEKCDIEDRSKASLFTKLVVCLQILWFLLETIGRLA